MLDLLIHIAAAVPGLLCIVGPLAFGVAAVCAVEERRRQRALRRVTAEVRDATERVGR